MLERKIRKRIEWAFYNYSELKKNAEEYILDVAESQMAVNYDKLPVQSSNGNSIERTLINGIDKNIAYKWCKVVEQTIEHFTGTGKDTLVKMRYFEKKSEHRLSEKLFVDRSAIYDWINEVLTYGAMVALQLGIIKIF